MRYKCKDFYCLYIPLYPSDIKHLKIKDNDDPRWHSEAYKLISIWFVFKDKLIEKLFGVNLDFFRWNYACFTVETIVEFLEIWYNIRLHDAEHGYQFLIPVQYTELINWIQENKPSWSRERKHYRLGLLKKKKKKTEFYFTPKAREFSLRVLKENILELTEENKIDLR